MDNKGYKQRPYGKNLTNIQKVQSWSDSGSQNSWQRVSNMGSDRIDKGTSYWVTIQIGIPPIGT